MGAPRQLDERSRKVLLRFIDERNTAEIAAAMRRRTNGGATAGQPTVVAAASTATTATTRLQSAAQRASRLAAWPRTRDSGGRSPGYGVA